MSRPAFARSAVWSTTHGGLPGPAQMAFFPLAIAALTTPGPAGDHEDATPRGASSAPRRSRWWDRPPRTEGSAARPRRSMASFRSDHQAAGDPLGAGVHVEHHRVARRDHADGVAGDRGKRVCHRGDRPDHPVGGALGDRQPVLVGECARAPRPPRRGSLRAARAVFIFLSRTFPRPVSAPPRCESDSLASSTACAHGRDHPRARVQGKGHSSRCATAAAATAPSTSAKTPLPSGAAVRGRRARIR